MATKSEFKVALNPRNPEANSFFDPRTGVNLFLGPVKDRAGNLVAGPISHDISHLAPGDLDNIKQAIKHGTLIIAAGAFPEGLAVEDIRKYAAPRSRWDESMSKESKAVQESWEALVLQAEEKKKASEKTASGKNS